MKEKHARRDFLKKLVTGYVGLCALNNSCTKLKNDSPSNIILILTDDQGYGDAGFMGNTVIKTPNLDLLAESSAVFSQFYCCPVCAPTRSSILSGKYNYKTGVVHTSRGGAKMRNSVTTIAEILKQHGYRTGIFGKWHLGDNYPMRPTEQGFDSSLIHLSGAIGQAPDIPNSYFNPKLWRNNEEEKTRGYCTDVFTDNAIEFLQNNYNKPFFLYLPYNVPHTPLAVPESYLQNYLDQGIDQNTARVYAMLTNLDDNLSRLIKKLNDLGLTENTMLIFLSDNGPAGKKRYNAGLLGSKGQTYEGGIRVPCFINWPNKIKPKRIDQIAAHIDITPTILDLLNIPKPVDLEFDGKSLKPLLFDNGNDWKDRYLFFQFNRGMIPRLYQNCAIRNQKYKLVSKYQNSGEIGEHLTFLQPDFELYNMITDPGESRNLANELPHIVNSMKSKYEEWYKEMESDGDFQPEWIHIGSNYANPVHLCRYQDMSYVDAKPRGWPVKILTKGEYRVSINNIGYNNNNRLYVQFNETVQSVKLFAGENTGFFQLPKGKGILKIWFENNEINEKLFTANHTLGDVEIELLTGYTSSE